MASTIQLSEEQLNAVNANRNVVVSAGAGSGKTRVVVERCLNRILHADPLLRVSIDQILMITFTLDATDEMRQRIRGQLRALCQQAYQKELSPNLLSLQNSLGSRELLIQYLQEQENLLERASISTIHGFCMRTIHEFFDLLYTELGPTPISRVIDESHIYRLKKNAFKKLLRQHYKNNKADENNKPELSSQTPHNFDPIIQFLITQLKNNETELMEYICQISDFIQSLPKPKEWIAKQKSILQSPTLPKNWEDFFTQYPNPDSKEKHSLPLLKEQWPKLAHHIQMMLELTEEFEAEFTQQKYNFGGITFDDMLQLTLKIVSQSEAADILRKRYKLIFVDEFQDTDPIQDAIIQCIAQNNLFLVGDVKQSIYSFRHAEPQIFEDYIHKAENQTDSWFYAPLMDNYRSHPQIISFINHFFNILMKEEKNCRFDPLHSQVKIPSQIDENSSFPPIHILLTSASTGKSSDADSANLEDEYSGIEKEAALLAQELLKMKKAQFQVRDKTSGALRAMEWSDVALFCRGTLQSTAISFIKEFEKRGIPINAPGIPLTQCVEILDILNIIHLLENPHQDFHLAGLLYSPFFNMTRSEFLEMRRVENQMLLDQGKSENESEQYLNNTSLWDRIRKLIRSQQMPEGSVKTKLILCVESIKSWRQMLRILSLSNLIEKILEHFSYEDYISIQPLAEQKLRNIDRFLRMIERFDPLKRQGVHNFLEYIKNLEESNSGDNVSSSGYNPSAVQMMTIHKSKGLEFPIVCLLCLEKKFNFDYSSRIFLDKNLGIVPSLVYEDYDTEYNFHIPSQKNNSLWPACKQFREQRTLAEELRILYVGMTRARDRLILSGTRKINKKEQSFLDFIKKWAEKINNPNLCSLLMDTECNLSDYKLCFPPKKQDNSPKEQDNSPKEQDNFTLQISLAHLNDTPLLPPPSPKENLPLENELSAMAASLASISDYSYPHAGVVNIPSRNSISSIRKAFTPPAEQSYFPLNKEKRSKLFQEKKLACERGTAYHIVFDHLKMDQSLYQAPPDVEFYHKQIEEILKKRFLTQEQYELIDKPEIFVNFWKSEVGQLFLSQWDCVLREASFAAMINKHELTTAGFPESQTQRMGDDFLCLQGVIDLMMLGKKEIWILDYKSSLAKKMDPQKLIKKYSSQIKLYKIALEKIYHLPVTRSYLYSLELNKIIPIK